MKITGHIVSAQDCGYFIEITLRGNAASGPAWLGMMKQVVRVASNERNRRAMSLGRSIELIIRPKP